MGLKFDAAPPERGPEPDHGVMFFVFMLVFWPVALLFGIVDFYLIPNHDLRLLDLVLGGAAGALALHFYRSREKKKTLSS